VFGVKASKAIGGTVEERQKTLSVNSALRSQEEEGSLCSRPAGVLAFGRDVRQILRFAQKSLGFFLLCGYNK
jgi:hypothetical protein